MAAKEMETTNKKIKRIEELAKATAELRQHGKKIVHCHGVFDLLHIGHIKHLEAARKYGDVLVVTLTPDRFVNKGPQRPAFSRSPRGQAVAVVGFGDLGGVNSLTAGGENNGRLRPRFFVKRNV